MSVSVLIAAAVAATVPALEVRRFPAPEARQGAAAGDRHVYAIDNSQIAQYDKASGRRLRVWTGDPARYQHLNSCSVVDRSLVCAASNYPNVPMASSIETFDAETLRPLSSLSLGRGHGSLTWIDWHAGSWWACFANYDRRGGEPGRDHRWTRLVRYSADFREQGAWLFPKKVLKRLAPRSSSGGAWNEDGLLYVTGHDRRELYAMRVPATGSRLDLVAIIPTVTAGQAVDWDPISPRILWSVDRSSRAVVASRVPPVGLPN